MEERASVGRRSWTLREAVQFNFPPKRKQNVQIQPERLLCFSENVNKSVDPRQEGKESIRGYLQIKLNLHHQ